MRRARDADTATCHDGAAGYTAAMIGVLLVNVGTPDSTEVADVRRYLAEFLSDRWVLDMHPVARWLLLNVVILRTRPARSAAAYKKIWMDRGSPLVVYGQDLATALGAELGQGFQVRLAMRYGKPAIGPTLRAMQQQGCDRFIVVPLYPQYAQASTKSAVDAILQTVQELPAVPDMTMVGDFYVDDGFLDAVVARYRESLADFQPDHVLFSYHGLPEHQVKLTEVPGPDGVVAGHCQAGGSCCDAIVPANRFCYRAQCFATTRALAARLGLADDGYSVAFQSRLGKVPWIRPYTDEVLPQLAADGVKRLAVLTPSFVTDCLETLEEIGIAGRESFLEAGGDDFRLVPCVNAHPTWVAGLAAMVRRRG